MVTKEVFAKNLMALVKASGKSQRAIADDLGVSDILLNGWVHGAYFPRMDKIDMIADYFHVSKSFLLDDPEKKTQSFSLEKDEAEIMFAYRFSKEEGRERIREYVAFVFEKYRK